MHRLGRVSFSQAPPVVKRGVVVGRQAREAQPREDLMPHLTSEGASQE